MDVLRLSRQAMACEFEIILPLSDGAHGKRQELIDIANLAFEEIERLDGALNCFNPTSEVSYLNAQAARKPVIVTPDLFEILRMANEVWGDTNGGFDVTAGPIIDLWREAERTGVPPDKQAIDTAMKSVGMAHVRLDEGTHAVSFDVDGIRINLGAIGKGYAVRQAASIVKDYSVRSGLVSAGTSTIQAFGHGPDGGGWKVGIRHPSKMDERVAEVELSDQAMSMSGGPAQRDKAVSERFEHIVDPATGMSARSAAAAVAVITNDAMLSDALATAFYLRGKEFADSYCARHQAVRAIFSFE